MHGFNTSESEKHESTLLPVWKGEKDLIQLTTHDEIAHSAWNTTLMQIVQFVDKHQFVWVFRALFPDTKEAEKSPYQIAALNRQRRRLSGRIKQPLEDDGVL